MNIGSECRYISEELDKQVENVVKLLVQRGLTVATAESCTGGLIAALITSVPGASDVFGLGICTYSNNMKCKFLGVQEDELCRYGAVSSQVALSMVKGLAECSGADICVSVTGIAGPDGGSEEKPVGTVWFGFFVRGKVFTRLPKLWELADKSRSNIRMSAAKYAFGVIMEVLMEEVQ